MERLKRTKAKNTIFLMLVTFEKIALVEGVETGLKESWGKEKQW